MGFVENFLDNKTKNATSRKLCKFQLELRYQHSYTLMTPHKSLNIWLESKPISQTEHNSS